MFETVSSASIGGFSGGMVGTVAPGNSSSEAPSKPVAKKKKKGLSVSFGIKEAAYGRILDLLEHVADVAATLEDLKADVLAQEAMSLRRNFAMLAENQGVEIPNLVEEDGAWDDTEEYDTEYTDGDDEDKDFDDTHDAGNNPGPKQLNRRASAKVPGAARPDETFHNTSESAKNSKEDALIENVFADSGVFDEVFDGPAKPTQQQTVAQRSR